MGSSKGLWKERPSAHTSECFSTTACPVACILLVWNSQTPARLQSLCTGWHPSLSATAQWVGLRASREEGTFWTECVGQERWLICSGYSQNESQEDQGTDLISHTGLKADNRRESSTWANEVEDRRPQYTPALNLNPSHTHPPRPLTTFLRSVIGIQISPGLVAAGGTVAWRILRQLWEDVDCLTGGWESRVQKEKLGVQGLVVCVWQQAKERDN
ncbi:PREDICTED: protein FAM231D-like [Mandrillus leucophaeus]|uniref:protein FAM231D-like n=1 Tax=Mandrillus leucophaeus TaxID=9568 RepID=UPI0005F39A90|nr:PREDICTED: protein FAM231D-like [Mandrillus leucophaeus]